MAGLQEAAHDGALASPGRRGQLVVVVVVAAEEEETVNATAANRRRARRVYGMAGAGLLGSFSRAVVAPVRNERNSMSSLVSAS